MAMNASMDFDAFGPQVPGQFDLTLYFEQAVLAIIPSALFLAAVPWRAKWLLQRHSISGSRWLLLSKLVSRRHLVSSNDIV